MNSRYFFLMVMLLNLLLPVYGSDDTMQVNDTTMRSNDTTYVEIFGIILNTPIITPTECEERIIAHGDTLAYDTLKYYFDLGKNKWDIRQRYTFILSDKFDYTLAKLDMFDYFVHVYSSVGKMRMDTTTWNCIFDYVQVCASRNKNMAKWTTNNKYQNHIKRILIDTLSRYATIVTPIEPKDSVAYRVFCQDQLVNFYIPQDQQPNYEDNLSYALIMADKYHYPKAYADVYKYIVNIYKSNDMTMPPAMQKLALNFLRKGVALNDSTALAEMSNLQGEQGLNHANESDETIYDPIQTPVYMGTTLFCSKIAYDVNETPCDAESRLVVYSSDVRDTIQGALRFIISFDIATAGANKELVVQDINDIEIFRCDNPEWDADTFIPIFREALSGWHWWLGDYINPLTMYPRQQWTVKYIIVPDSTSHGNKR